MPVKVELLMEAFGQSWSEAHYWLLNGNLQQALSQGTVLATYRALALGLGANVTAVRASAVPANLSTTSNNNGGFGWFPNVIADPTKTIWQATLPNVSLLLRLFSTTVLQAPPKALYLAAPPTIAVQGGANQNQDDNIVANGGATFLQNLKAYLFQLTGYSPPNSSQPQTLWGYRIRDLSASVNALGVVASAGAPAMIGIQTLSPLFQVVAGSEVYVKGFRRLNDEQPGLNKTWRVASVISANPPTVPLYTYFLLNSGAISPTNFQSFGIIAPLEFLYVPYDANYDIVKAVTRKRGGSIGLRRGRSRTR